MRVSGLSAVILSFLFFSPQLMGKSVSAEKNFPHLSGKYFGQKEPENQAELYAPGLISLEGRYEFALSFSPKGDELMFSVQIPKEPACVYYSKQKSGIWTEPVPISLSQGIKKEEMEAFFSWDGKYIYFAPYDEGLDVRIWSVEIQKDGWRNPKILGRPVSDDSAFFPTCSKNGVLYYSNITKNKIYTAYLVGGEVVKAEDSGIEFGGHPFIAPDESFCLIDALQEEGLGGRDIYVAFKKSDNSWTKPINLDSKVNTENNETCPSLSADGKYLFFSRYNEPGEISNLYWISTQVIEEARKKLNSKGL
jgi:Tol biopolymer transport system component